ncbi:PEP-CTERM sorting domain-containing protein [Pseudorhodoferax sp. Leaf267]|uniref:PEP-CTERM sorting domain-containing protein n=1 Tax=Pseudorhodoferax sp. Leaf267 TaxID=1736316 RepID=UPI0006F59926|nr:PEP-CTERM sorting domain-containing protein [Pseudorhodoferax sp. Leaf267]KQP11838.1 hypothetical protein ASF43_23065 [Pseudorhodoferax sp. Leaf267]
MVSLSIRKRVYALLLGSLLCLQAQAVTVTATASDIADTVAGEDRWQISYRITGALPQFHTLTFELSSSTYGALTPTSVPAALDPSLLSGGPAFNDVLSLLALDALGAGQSLNAVFAFNLLSAPTFAPQAFNEADELGVPASSGLVQVTVADPNAVPEPASWMLLGLGMAMLRRQAARPPAR